MKKGFAFLGFFLAMFGGSDAFACECVPNGPPCQSYFEFDRVFVGTVRSISPDTQPSPGRMLRVEFADVESADGKAQPTVSVLTADTAAECGYAFRTGERYVVYANREDAKGDLHVVLCSRTQPLASASEDLQYFQTLSSPSKGAHVYGTIARSHGAVVSSATEPAPILSVSVTLRGPGGSFGTRTAGDGRFDIHAIPPGKYELTAIAVPGSTGGTMRRSLELKHPHACFVADFAFPPDTGR